MEVRNNAPVKISEPMTNKVTVITATAANDTKPLRQKLAKLQRITLLILVQNIDVNSKLKVKNLKPYLKS